MLADNFNLNSDFRCGWEGATAAYDRVWGADNVRTRRMRERFTREYLFFV